MSNVETMAKAMFDEHRKRNPTWGGQDTWDDQPEYRRDDYRAMAQAAIDALTPFWAVAYGDGGQSEECYERRESAEEMLAEYADATGLDDGYLVTTSFTSWVRVSSEELQND